MSKIKKYKIIALFSIAILLSACNLGGTSNTYKYFNFNNFFIDKNNNLSITCRYNYDDENETFVISQNKTTHVWHENNNTHDLPVNSEHISYVNNKVIIKDNNGTKIYEDILPTIEDIEQSTGIALPKALIEYNVLRADKYHAWDKQTIIASIGINKYHNKHGSTLYSTIYYFYLIKKDLNWDIGYITKEIEEDGNGFYGNPFISPIRYHLYHNEFAFSTDEKAPLCHYSSTNEIYCFAKENNIVEYKKLFGDIYNEEYKTTINKYQKKDVSTLNIYYFFDSNNNMHLFYNDTEHAKGKYFHYVMFTEDEPTVPKYEQKIYRTK